MKSHGHLPQQPAKTTEEQEALIHAILQRLGIKPTSSTSTKERKSLLSRIIAAISADVICHENEQTETMQRMAGYWRYVNRRTYNAMVRTNMLWDWATGEKLPEVDESDSSDTVEEDELSVGGSPQHSTPPTELSGVGDLEDEDSFVYAGKSALRFDSGRTSALADFVFPVQVSEESFVTGKATVGEAPSENPSPCPKSDECLWQARVSATTPNRSTLSRIERHTVNTKRITDPPFHIEKDNRIFETPLHQASPVKKQPPQIPPRFYLASKISNPRAKPQNPSDPATSNPFCVLKTETPAPCDDPQLHNHQHQHHRQVRPSTQTRFSATTEDTFPALPPSTHQAARRASRDQDTGTITRPSPNATLSITPARKTQGKTSPPAKRSKVLNITTTPTSTPDTAFAKGKGVSSMRQMSKNAQPQTGLQGPGAMQTLGSRGVAKSVSYTDIITIVGRDAAAGMSACEGKVQCERSWNKVVRGPKRADQTVKFGRV